MPASAESSTTPLAPRPPMMRPIAVRPQPTVPPHRVKRPVPHPQPQPQPQAGLPRQVRQPHPPSQPQPEAVGSMARASEASAEAFLRCHGCRATQFLVAESARYQLAISTKPNKFINRTRLCTVLNHIREWHASDPNLKAEDVRRNLCLFGPGQVKRREAASNQKAVLQYLRRSKKLFVPANVDPLFEDSDEEYSDIEEQDPPMQQA